MEQLYQKNKLYFALVWIVGYLFIMSLSDDISRRLGIEKVVTLVAAAFMTQYAWNFLRKNGLMEEFGLCRFQGNLRDYLWFLPMLAILSVNLWNGVRMGGSVTEMMLFVGSMLCVGFLEELIFRGFLFRALCEDNVKAAVLISSLSFGVGHIVNLLNGSPFLATLLQVCYATALGFLFTVIVCRSRSLWPCIIVHGLLNSLSFFGCPHASAQGEMISATLLCVMALGYAGWILRRTRA